MGWSQYLEPDPHKELVVSDISSKYGFDLCEFGLSRYWALFFGFIISAACGPVSPKHPAMRRLLISVGVYAELCAEAVPCPAQEAMIDSLASVGRPAGYASAFLAGCLYDSFGGRTCCVCGLLLKLGGTILFVIGEKTSWQAAFVLHSSGDVPFIFGMFEMVNLFPHRDGLVLVGFALSRDAARYTSNLMNFVADHTEISPSKVMLASFVIVSCWGVFMILFLPTKKMMPVTLAQRAYDNGRPPNKNPIVDHEFLGVLRHRLYLLWTAYYILSLSLHHVLSVCEQKVPAVATSTTASMLVTLSSSLVLSALHDLLSVWSVPLVISASMTAAYFLLAGQCYSAAGYVVLIADGMAMMQAPLMLFVAYPYRLVGRLTGTSISLAGLIAIGSQSLAQAANSPQQTSALFYSCGAASLTAVAPLIYLGVTYPLRQPRLKSPSAWFGQVKSAIRAGRSDGNY
ncbi:MAG: hypothetical protein KVP17_002716 [Porospora cf. gigantea B]|uniref:uncharacterized protein n=1 Tax=Porospora cf. gigantea B TaxID=2853592 RepID=UPI003571F461|nr:MAG: hypothetical protein KVP17_002716 [Porospora cf. gigantea B]